MSLVSILLGFPTGIFTLLLGLMLVYWVFVILGALDLDFLGGGEDAAAGAVKGAFEGATKGAIDGATKGVLDGAMDVPDADGALASFVSALNLKHVPVTIVLSIFSLFGWITSAFAVQQLSGVLPLPGWLFGSLVLLASTVVGLVAASFGGRPFAKVFRVHGALTQRDMVGKIAIVETSKVTRTFGDARLEDRATVTLQIRSDEPNRLQRGDRCMIVEWDQTTQAFVVERLPDSFPEERLKAEALAEAEAAAEAEAEVAEGRAPSQVSPSAAEPPK